MHTHQRRRIGKWMTSEVVVGGHSTVLAAAATVIALQEERGDR